MIQRYAVPRITRIWSDGNKLRLWQKVELAVLQARADLEEICQEMVDEINVVLLKARFDLRWWKREDERIHHDLNAFLNERKRHLPPRLQRVFHAGMTSFDTEEPAFCLMLRASVDDVLKLCRPLEEELARLAERHRYTVMMARTHGQEAELITFGKRCLSWLCDFRAAHAILEEASGGILQYSKISGAVGNYSSISPEVEKRALAILGLEPYPAATQIMPRHLYVPIASSLYGIVAALNKIALDIRLGARSGKPLYHEPFKKTQTGSSAMPHKKNTVRTEQVEGMQRDALGELVKICQNVNTWEERAIEQSCVERMAWPDLFHVTAHSLKVMTKVLMGLVVYPDNMLWEVHCSRGCYASNVAKEWLKEKGLAFGLDSEACYRIVQLAAFNVMEPGEAALAVRERNVKGLADADDLLAETAKINGAAYITIGDLIAFATLRHSRELDVKPGTVQMWNDILKKIFSSYQNGEEWRALFRPSYLLRNEQVIYDRVLRG